MKIMDRTLVTTAKCLLYIWYVPEATLFLWQKQLLPCKEPWTLDPSSEFVLPHRDLVWVTQDSQPQSYQKNAPLTPPMKNYQRILLPNTFGTDFLDQSPNLKHQALHQQKCCTACRRAISQKFLPHRRKPQTSWTLKPVTGGARPVWTETKRPETNTRRDKEHLRILVGTSDAKI